MPTLYFSLNTVHLEPLVASITEECRAALEADCLWARANEDAPPESFRARLARSEVLVVVLGASASNEADAAIPPLSERMRMEVVTAVHQDLILVPVLVDTARLPGKAEARGVWKWLLNAKTHRLRSARWLEDLHPILDDIETELSFRRDLMEKAAQAGSAPIPDFTDAAGNPLAPPRLGMEFSGALALRRTIDTENQNLDTARRKGDRTAENNALAALGLAYAQLGQTQRAIQCFEEQLPLVRATQNAHAECDLLANLGDAYAVSGDLTRAKQHYEEQLCRADALGSAAFIASAYNGLGHVHVKRDELARAIDCYRKALKRYRELEDHDKELELLVGIGLNQQKAGEGARAAETLEDALAAARFVENRKEEARVRVDLAEIYIQLNDPARASEHLTAAEDMFSVFDAAWTDPWKSRITALWNTIAN
ncbi:tetratricopeptide repeat protein [Nitrospina watsonii]|uniref:TPR_REGION domain-containing protein n=1 Tax=Nitrospina watsonii TaxID=1323948 RepID=A0ABM9HBX5_9BACT|nr:tetratricopeptide repeat protein [Nitrospina watsonii]CAI2717583.1 TPR_REGION domain-containing protein [Nitrospina watsonii]